MSRLFTKDNFIEKSIKYHGNKYDYSLVEYKNDSTDVKIICYLHGVFYQKPNVHYRSGCPICGIMKRSNNRKNDLDRLIYNFKQKHGDRYDYSFIDYTSMKDKVKIKCNIHNIFFLQMPEKHLISKTGGCPECNSIGKGLLDNDYFIRKSIKKHGECYLYDNCNYEKSNKKVKIICKIHGEFEITPNSHLNGRGCQKCAKNYKYTINDLILEFNKIHKDKYEYDFTNYHNIKSKIKVKCDKHSYFETSAELLMKGYGCSSCGKISTGEEKVSEYLLKNNIVYEKQKSFDECFFINKLQFDFFIPSKNICIEYDGRQHFEPVNFFGGMESYKHQVEKDNIKNDFCNKMNIKLLRIPYYEYNNIEKILENI